MTCPHCGAEAQGHYLDHCRDNMKQQRDEAREVAAGLLAHLEAIWELTGDMLNLMEGNKEEIKRIAKRFYPWLKQPTVDEKEG